METNPTQTNETLVVELTPLEKLRAELDEKRATASAEAKDRIETASLTASMQLLDNTDYVDYITRRDFREANIKTLTGLMTLVNSIAPVKLPGEGDAKVNSYPINDRLFGTELALLLGLLQTAQATNIAEQKENILAILSLPISLVEDTMQAFGTTAYWSKRTFNKFDEIKGDYGTATVLLQEVAQTMKLNPLDISKFTPQAYQAHFDQAKAKAETKFAEFQVTLAVDSNSEFTLNPTAE